MHLKKRKISSAMLVFIYLFTILLPQTANSAMPKLGTVNIDSKSSVQLNQVQLMPNNEQQILIVNITIHNKGTKVISLLDYWLKAKLSNGGTISLNLLEADKSKDTVAPGTSKSYNFYKLVDKSVKYSNLSFQVIKWDFSSKNFEKVLGTIKIPANYSPSTASTFMFGSTEFKVSFSNLLKVTLDEEYRLKMTASITNNGTRSITLPVLKYYLVTSSANEYVMTPSVTTALAIQPKMTQKINLTVDIPSSVKGDKFKLYMAYGDEAAKADIPLNSFSIDMSTAAQGDTGDNVPAGTEKSLMIGDSKYGVTLQSVQRLPWEDDDILAAMVTIRNLNKTAAAIPDMKGTFYLDEVPLNSENTKKLQIDNLVALPVNGTIQMQYYIKVPYHNDMQNLALELLHQVSEDTSNPEQVKLATFRVNKNQIQSMVKIPVDQFKKSVNSGKSSSQKVSSIRVYESNNSKIFNVLLEVSNDEQRMTALNLLSGYLKTTNGDYYPVTISEVKEKISPKGKAMFSLHAKMPIGTSTTGATLILGDSVADKSAYINVSEFNLPAESDAAPKGELTGLKLYPYELKIEGLKIKLASNATVHFQYTLAKDYQYEAVPGGHSVVMELINDKSKVSYTKEFALDQELTVGTHQQTMVANMNIENPERFIQALDGFTINIYDQFEGHKKLLASRRTFAYFLE